MNDKELAKNLLQSTRFIRGEVAVEIVLAFIKEIRAEAAGKAWDYLVSQATSPKWGMTLLHSNLRAAIMGGKE